jgi:hypothetical protein
MNVNIKQFNKQKSRSFGFTLAEVLAALTIGSMVMIIVLAIYSRAQTGAAGVVKKLENDRLPREVLQRISEDLDRVVATGQDTQINIDNKLQDGFSGARLEIVKQIIDSKNQPQILEKIVWQSAIEPDSGQLTLYRSHSGIAMEDSLLDSEKKDWQRELFIPICTGLTFFRIEIPQEGSDTPLDKWAGETLPNGITILLSLAKPQKSVGGTLEVSDEDKIFRSIAIDRTRKPAFTLPAMPDMNQPDANQKDANSGQQNQNQNQPVGNAGGLPPPPPPPMR